MPPAPHATLLRADQISVAYNGLIAVSGVGLTLQQGEIVTLIGPNGAGKSTIIRALLGLVPLAAGTIARKSDLTIGYAPQTLNLDSSMPITVARFLGLTPRKPEESVVDALARTGVTGCAAKQMTDLSGGQLRRVLLARAMMGNPDLLVLDEPVAGVDAQGQSDLYALIGEYARAHHCGVLIVSHDLHLVMAQTDHVICINGHICCEGHPAAVKQDPAYQTLFNPLPGDSAAQSGDLAPYEHHHDHHHH